jgi:transposase
MRNDVRSGDLIKILWHDTQGLCLFVKRLERGRFIWPSPAENVVAITSGQLGYLRLENATTHLAADSSGLIGSHAIRIA